MTKGMFPNPLEWMRLLVDAQQAQIDVTRKLVEAGSAAFDPARTEDAARKLEDAARKLEEAGQQALDAAEALARAQWEWLSQWRC